MQQTLVSSGRVAGLPCARAPAPRSRAPVQPFCLHSSRPLASTSAPGRPSKLVCRNAAETATTSPDNGASATVPKPIVKIDNQTDPFATIVTVQFGDRLGELLDTIAALKKLGLNIRRAKIDQSDPAKKNKFYITDAATSEKVVKSAKIEEIRLTILQCMTEFHPESEEQLATGVGSAGSFNATSPLGTANRKHVVNTFIQVEENEAGTFTVVNLRTRDRPGLLVDIVRTLKDVNVNVLSAEVDTEGPEAIDTFYVTYHGEPLSPAMTQLVTNCLQYYLSLAEVEKEESY